MQKVTKLKYQNIDLEIIQKRIRHLHIRIRAPLGQVRVSAPLHVAMAKILQFIDSKIAWIKESQDKISKTKFEPKKKFLSGEEHNFFDKKYLLLIEEGAKNLVTLSGDKIILQSKNTSAIKKRQKILEDFYRQELKKLVAEYIKKWEVKMSVSVKEFGIKKMKTRWGTCNIKDQRIWINLELAKKPLQCLEYIVVHEMNHLLEKNHTKRFHSLMDQFLVDWKVRKEKLNGKYNH